MKVTSLARPGLVCAKEFRVSSSSKIVFFYDYVSPNAYLAWRRLQDLAKDSAFELESVPIFLGGLMRATGNKPPLEVFGDIKPKRDYFIEEMKRYARRYDMALVENPFFPFLSLRALRVRLAAGPLGLGERCDAAFFDAAWLRGENLADAGVVQACLEAADLPAADLLDASRDEAVKQQLSDNTQRAEQAGAFGAPSFVFADQLYFGKDSLPDLMVDLARA